MTKPIPIVMCPPMSCDPCGSESTASRWAICRRCKAVIARCSVHGDNMERVRDTHCSAR